LYSIDISSVPEIKANPTLKNCCSRRAPRRCLKPNGIRTTRKIVKFGNLFTMEGVGRVLPAGNYEVVTDEELIEGLSFPAYRRVATMILAPTQTSHSIEMLTIDPRDLAAAVERDTLVVKRRSG
jgi:hypothetical protein